MARLTFERGRRGHHGDGDDGGDGDGMTPGEAFGVDRVLTDLSKAVGLAPYGYFRVSNSNFLGMTATLFTYMVVLLQFRASYG